jgi:uncharacterized protein (DUF2236 family)
MRCAGLSDTVLEMPHAPVSPVSREHMEDFWAVVRNETPNPAEGIFGPHSVCWKVDRECALFLGAGRAALLQLAHPWVAAALDQHSNLRSDPLARFHNTFRVVFTMVFGTLDQALAASRHLYELHTHILGEIPGDIGRFAQGSKYAANEVNALLWVYATLIESALIAHDCVLPPLSNHERETYYTESVRISALFGIPPAALPANWQAFENYMTSMVSSDALGVNSLSRELAHGVLHGRGSWLPVPKWYRTVTIAWLPERLQREFGLEFGTREQRAAATAAKWLPRIYRRLPASVRFVGPYQEACARLAGHSIHPLIRLSNHFWMGQPLMMFGDTKQ